MLSDIQPFVQSYAEVIARVTGIHVEIMDSHMVRIAGTGMYYPMVGESLEQAGEVYKEVMRQRETIFIDTPRQHRLCAKCPAREECKECFSLATPIVSGETLHGVIGLVSFDNADRQRMMGSLDSYTAFIAFIADALTHKLDDMEKLNRATHFLDLMLQAVDTRGQGVAMFDSAGAMLYCSAAAREFFSLSADALFSLSCVRQSGQSLYGFEEFEVAPPQGTTHTVLGKITEVATGNRELATLFVFELPASFARLVGDVAVGASMSGFDSIAGNSTAMRKLKVKAGRVADSSSSILITGESGTGKELLARAIHQSGSRREYPFVAINCGAIPETLLESELFGYVSGAFTGASAKGRMGKFELAQGGVIFLDEISTMPLYMQVKLLRVLQEHVITRLGSNRDIHVDVRIIAASNENLQECIARNIFREDLYYRLNVIPLHIPPLREREGDIEILAEFFLEKYCGLFNKKKPHLKASIIRLLEACPWHGNVRELEHVMEYAINMMPEDGLLTLDCLPADTVAQAAGLTRSAIRTGRASGGSQSFGGQPAEGPTPGGIEPLAVLEERAIKNALETFGATTEGKKMAARALGLGLATLYRKIASFSN